MYFAWWFKRTGFGRWNIRKKGRKDGSNGTPQDNSQDPSNFERGLEAQCLQVIQSETEKHIPSIQKIEGERQHAFAEFKQHIAAFVDFRVGYNQEIKATSPSGRHRLVLHQVSRPTYLLVMLLIVVGEFALNAKAFNVFRQPMLDTLLMSLTVAVGLPMSAHFVGMHIKQWRPPAIKGIVFPLFVIATVIGALWGVNVARTATLAGLSAEDLQSMAMITKAFFFINVFVFAVAMYLSFSAHDENAQLDKSQAESDKLDKKIKKLDKKLNNLAGVIDSRHVAHEARVNRIIAQYVQLVLEYRDANEEGRTGPPPKAHSSKPTVEIPPQLEEEVQRPESERVIEHWREIWRDIRVSEVTTKPQLPRVGN